MSLFRQYFRVQRSGLLVWAGINGFLGWSLGASAKGLDASNALTEFIKSAMEKLPAAIQSILGMAPGVSALDNFVQGKVGFWMAIALPIYGCLMAVAVVSREIDLGTADFLFALPVKRQEVLVARWGVMAANLSAVAVTTWAGLCAGMAMSGISGNFAGYFWMIMQAAFVGMAMGSLALLASMWAPDYERAMKRSLGGVGVLFFVDIWMEMAELPRFTRAFNPFSYFSTLKPLVRSGPAWEDATALIAMSLLALWLAVRVFRSREIEA